MSTYSILTSISNYCVALIPSDWIVVGLPSV